MAVVPDEREPPDKCCMIRCVDHVPEFGGGSNLANEAPLTEPKEDDHEEEEDSEAADDTTGNGDDIGGRRGSARLRSSYSAGGECGGLRIAGDRRRHLRVLRLSGGRCLLTGARY